MKINAFKVFALGHVQLDTILSDLEKMPLAGGLREVDGTRVRLEEARRDNSGLWQLDFAKIRQSGPGRASLSRPIEDFDLNDDEGFGEETAGYFDPKSGFLILQYNHHGPRSSTIQSYLFRFALAAAGKPEADEFTEGSVGFNLAPVLRGDASTRLRRMQIMKKFEFSIYVPGALDAPEASRRSLSSVLDDPVVSSAEHIKVEITAGRGRGRSLNLEGALRIANDLLGIREGTTALKVRGRADEDTPTEPIDLLEARLQADIPVLMGAGRRYARSDRWAALKQAYDTWRTNNLLR